MSTKAYSCPVRLAEALGLTRHSRLNGNDERVRAQMLRLSRTTAISVSIRTVGGPDKRRQQNQLLGQLSAKSCIGPGKVLKAYDLPTGEGPDDVDA